MNGVVHVLKPKPRSLGGALTVRRVLPAIEQRMVGPFVFFDHIGPVRFAPGEGIDVRPHPHIGLATVTYLYEGEILHRDTLGYEQAIQPGDVNWMTAGRGIAHSERTVPETRARGYALHGVQTWVALPKEAEETAPSFHHHPSAALPEWREGETALKLIAGSAWGRESPVKVFSPTLYVDLKMPAGASIVIPPEHAERGAYVSAGALDAGGLAIEEAQMAILTPGEAVTLTAGPAGARVMLLGGAAMDGPRHMWWNFVSSSQARIEQAREDWRSGVFGKIPGDETEFIPLPER